MRSPALRHVLTHLITPLLMCVGMGLAYMGAFVTPEPHHLPVAVVGTGPQTKAFAQTVKDTAGDKLDVRTVATRADAVELLTSREVTGAYVPSAKAPELLVASAASDMGATAVEKVFSPVAAEEGVPLKVTDVAEPVADDPTGQGLFFLLIAVSIGSYASVAALGAAGGAPRPTGPRPCSRWASPPWSAASARCSPGRCSTSPTTISRASGAWPGCTRRASSSSASACTRS